MEEKKFIVHREEKKPALQRALSGLKNFVSPNKSEPYVIECSPTSSASTSEPLLARSTSSTLSEEDTLRISNILLQHGIDPINQYEKAQHAIIDRNKVEFLDALNKIPSKELKVTLHYQWQTLCEQEPLSKYSPPSRPENVPPLNIAIIQAAQEIWEEIYESRKSNKNRIPRLNLSIRRSSDDSSTSTTADESSQEKPEVIYTSITIKPCAQNSIKEAGCINTGLRLKGSNMKKEKKSPSP